MSDQNSNNPYSQYPPPGQGGVHGGHAPSPNVPAQPQGQPPAGWNGPQGAQPPQGAPQQAPPQHAPPAAPPQHAPTQGGQYPQGPPPQQAAPGAPWEQGSQAGYDQLPEALRNQLAGEVENLGSNINFSDVKYYNPKKPSAVGQTTESVIRILPGWQQAELGPNAPFWHKMERHFHLVELDDGRKIQLPRICPAKDVKPGEQPQPCPICERQERAQAAGDTDMAIRLKPRKRFYLNVIDAENTDQHWQTSQEGGQPVLRSMVWGIGPGLFRKINQIIGARGLIYDLTQGRYLKIYATKTGSRDQDLRYDIMDVGDACPVPQGFESVELVPLDQLDQKKDYATLAKEIRNTYPDAPGQGPAQGFQQPANPPYGNPYGQAPQQPPQGYGQPPAAAVQHQSPPAQATPPVSPQGAASPGPAAYPPQQQPAPAPQSAPPGWAQLPNGQWVQVAPQGGGQPPQGGGDPPF